MPVITVKTGKTEAAKKKELISRLTEVASEVTAIPKDSFTVFVEEFDFECIGVGGQTLEEKLKNM